MKSEILDKAPPCDLEAVERVLGSIMLRKNALDEISLGVDDFYDLYHRRLFKTFLAMKKDFAPAHDLGQVVSRLKSSGDCDAGRLATGSGAVVRRRLRCETGICFGDAVFIQLRL